MYQERHFKKINLLVKQGQPMTAQNLAQKEKKISLQPFTSQGNPESPVVQLGINTSALTYASLFAELTLRSTYIPFGCVVKDDLGLLLWLIGSDSGLLPGLLDTPYPRNENK